MLLRLDRERLKRVNKLHRRELGETRLFMPYQELTKFSDLKIDTLAHKPLSPDEPPAEKLGIIALQTLKTNREI
jgi:hypothetical protein